MLTVGQKVYSVEHLKAVGFVTRVNPNGDATIEFVTAPEPSLPYGHIIHEFWPVADQNELTILDEGK